MTKANLTPLPYIHKTGTHLPTLIVRSTIKDETTEAGLYLPEDVANFCEKGTVLFTGEKMTVKPGDEVLYRKVDRQSVDIENTLYVDGQQCDVLFENEVWAINGKPFNRLFVEAITESSITDSGLILTDDVAGVPHKGIVRDVPHGTFFKPGDVIEFRKEKQKAIYPTIKIEGKEYLVLFEKDVFTVNGKVSPHRVIISIDIPAQRTKRETTETGFVRSPLFLAMLYNLQYGKVLDIGEEAQKIYPKLNVGDTAIIHHTIEHQAYRLLKSVKGKHAIAEEHRIINCFDLNAREIFGKIENRKLFNKIPDSKIIPFHKNVFLKFEFDVFEKKPKFNSDIITEFDNDIDKCHELDDLKITLQHKKEDAVRKYQARFQGYIADIEKTEPEEHDKRQLIDIKIQQLKQDATKASAYYQKNHYLQCKITFPQQVDNNVLCTYKELYPINILGKKYLIAHKDLIIAKINQNDMGVITIKQALANRVFVRPTETQTSAFFIPDGAKERPQQGEVVAIGDLVENVKEGDTVLFQRLAGTEIEVNGEQLLVMDRNQLYAVVTVEKDLVAS